MRNLENTHPDMMQKWYDFLESYKNKYNLPQEWIDLGLWRYKRYNPQWKKLIKELNIELTPNFQNEGNISVSISKGFSPCQDGGYSLKGKINTALNLEIITENAPTLTKNYEYDEDLQILTFNGMYKKEKYNLNLFSDGAFILKTNAENFHTNEFLRIFLTIIMKSIRCTTCGTCASICNQKAIFQFEKRMIIDTKKCISCKQCITHCPLYSDVQNLMDSI